MPPAWRLVEGGLQLRLRVTPNAGRDSIEGVEIRDDGAAVLRVRVKAVADRGRANAAVLTLLAGALGVPRTALRITAGETARQKTVMVAGGGSELLARLPLGGAG